MPQVDFRITADAVVVNGQQRLTDDAGLDAEFTALAKQTPRPKIHVDVEPGIPFDRVVRFTKIMMDHPEFRLGLVTQRPSPQ